MAEMNLFGYTSEKDLMAAFDKRANKKRPQHKLCPLCKTSQKLEGSPAIYRHEVTGKISCG